MRELFAKLAIAQGNIEKAKKLYCGQGPQADAYLKKIRLLRQEMQASAGRETKLLAMDDSGTRIR